MKNIFFSCLLALPALVFAQNSNRIVVRYNYDTLAFNYSLQGQTVEIDDASAYDYFDRNPLDVTVPPLKIDGPAATIKINASEDSDLPGEVTLQAKKSDGAVVLVLTTGNQSTTYAIR